MKASSKRGSLLLLQTRKYSTRPKSLLFQMLKAPAKAEAFFLLEKARIFNSFISKSFFL
jgi:hypothetical protein